MAANFGYGTVADVGFVGFAAELESGGWKLIDVSGYAQASAADASALLTAPPEVGWKLRLRWGINAVNASFGAPPLSALDKTWDGKQRRLSSFISAAEDDDDPKVREAAGRLRAGLLSGDGTAQTKLVADGEVDFGRNQVARAAGDLASDVALLQLAPALAEVSQATEALALGVGREQGTRRSAPSLVHRAALASCANEFNAVREHLEWFLARTPAGATHERLTALQAPLQALLDRRTPPAHADAAAAAPAATPAAKP